MSGLKNIKSQIFIGNSALNALNKFLLKNNYKQHIIVCDDNTFKHCLPLLISNCPILSNANVFEIEPGEASKSLDVASQFWQTLIENNIGRDALVINLGGGVVCDFGGFCASIYKRGIDFVNVPTTLLAMTDASVGSKTALNFIGVKNILGTFYEPKSVFIDPIFLITLTNREVKNGLAEMVKMALIGDKYFWKQLNNPETSIDDELIKRAVLIKSKIVKKDPFDTGIRKSLNYGHSIGHAIEALTLNAKNPILHGEAVVIGMIIENHISYQLKLLTKEETDSINHFLLSSFKPVKIVTSAFNEIIEILKNDKKNVQSKLMFSLLKKIGLCQINVEVKSTHINKALQYYTKLSK